MSYNPNQPRVPAGHEGAGQWSEGGSASASILNSPLLDRDRSIKAALGIPHDEKRDGNVQLALLQTPIQIQPSVSAPRSRLTPGAAAVGVGALLGLGLLGLAFYQLSESNSDKQRTIVVFRRGKYRSETDDSESDTGFEPAELRILRNPQEITKVCGTKFDKIQDLVDETYDKVKKDMPYLSEQDLGNEVHKKVAQIVNGWDKSIWKAGLTYERIPPSDGKDRYGAKDSIRLDVHYRDPKTGTVCIAEIKTGRKVLEPGRMREVVNRAAARKENKEVKQFLVTEVRPKNAPAGRKLRGFKLGK